MTRYVVLGAGGIGIAVGVLLKSVGNDVLLITNKEDEASAIRANGARVVGVRDIEAYPDVRTGQVVCGSEDVLLVAVKAHQTLAALSGVEGTPKAVLSLQNGIEKEAVLAARFGSELVITSVVQVTATRQSAGVSHCAGLEASGLSAEYAPTRAVAQELADELTSSGVPTSVLEDAGALEWTKAAQWLGTSLLSAATGLTLDAVLRHRELARVYQSLVRECAAVARALGLDLIYFPGFYSREVLDLDEEGAIELLNELGREFGASSMAGYRTAMELDLAHGRIPELDPTAGAVERTARTVGVSCPVLETAHALVLARAEMNTESAQGGEL